MLSFELFFERCQSPVEVLRKYKDDPDVFISFTSEIEPRGKKEGASLNPRVDPTVNKKTSRVGLNPLTHFDTPAGVYSYPLKAMWDDIKQYDIPYVKEKPYVYVFRAKNPDRCARTSTYTGEDFKRDSEELMEMYPQYHLRDIINTLDVQELENKYPDLPKDYVNKIYIGRYYRDPPLRMFWSFTRSLGFLILHDIEKKKETKTKHITIWTHIMRQFYDGIIDDTGSSTIHGNEPTQAVFWTSAQFDIIDRIDRFCGKNKYDRDISRSEWTGERKMSTFFQNKKILDIVKKSYVSNTENKLSDGIKHYLSKSGVHDTLSKLKKGDSYPLSIGLDEVFNEIADTGYKTLAIELYLNNRNTDQKVFDDKSLSGISSVFLKERAAELIYLLKTNNSYESAKKLLPAFVSSDYGKEREALYVKLLNILFENIGRNTMDVIDTMLSIPYSKLLKTPKVVSMLTKAFDKSYSYYTSTADDVATNLINLISMTRTKNPTIWKRFFPYFVNGRTNNYSKAEVLMKFLDSKTGLDDELKEYIKTNSDASDHHMQRSYNEVWFRYYGVDLFTPKLSQLDSIKKSRKPKPVEGNFKYKFGDIVNMEFENNLIYGVVVSVIPSDGYYPNRYQIAWVDGPRNVSTEREDTLLDDYDPKPNFSFEDILEDDDGFLYKFISFTSDPTEVKVKDEDGDYFHKKAKDLIPYNPETSLHKPLVNVGDKVKLPYSKYGNKIGIVKNYKPFRFEGKYKILIDGDIVYRDSVTSLDDGEGNDDNNSETFYKYKPGDILTQKGGDTITKYVIKKIDGDKEEYIYDVYKDYGYGWVRTLENHNYPINWFDAEYFKLENPSSEKDALGDHGFSESTHEYSVGDTIIVDYKKDGQLTKFFITGITGDNYDYERYEQIGDDWDEGFQSSFEMKFFDKEMKKYGAKKVKPKTNKYDSGDMFLNTDGKYKTVVESFDEYENTYTIIYYAKDNENGQWNEYLKDKMVSKEVFENDIEKFIKDGLIYHDIKI